VYDLSDIVRLKRKYAKLLTHYTRNDHRVSKQLYGKYDKKTKNAIRSRLHLVSKRIVQHAVRENHSIVLENLTHIRESHRRGSQKERKSTRDNINTWPFWILQKAIKYKANWEKVPIEFLDPKNTSKICS
jgi:putative transposase